MASYYGMGRSNAFRVKDIDAFLAWISEFSTEIEVDRREASNACIIFATGEMGTLPSVRRTIHIPPPTTGPTAPTQANKNDLVKFTDIDFLAELAEHLVEDSILVWTESGSEGRRYNIGYAVAMTHNGEKEVINTHDILMMAKDRWGITPSAPEY